MFRTRLLVLAAFAFAPLPADADRIPTAFLFASTPVDAVPTLSLPALDRDRLATEDAQREIDGLPPRFAVPFDTAVDPSQDGLWEQVDARTWVWRYRIEAPGAYSLNLGFARFKLPPGASLLLYPPDAREQRGPFTADDNDAHGELWTPVLLTDDLVIELTVAAERRSEVELVLGRVGQGYRGFGAETEVVLSGSCNMDVECLPGDDPWRDTVKASATISTGGSTFCSGSLLNNTAQDKKPLFMTANHCGINSGNAASLVTYWNYENSTCRTPGSPASGGVGDGSLAQFNTGSIFRAASAPSDFTLVELDDPINPAFDLYWAGWDRSPGDFPCAPTADPSDPESTGECACIHHPNTDEKRITFVETTTATTSYLGTTSPGDGTHVWAHWDDDPPYFASPPGVTEPGSSGSPLYTAEHRFIGQLHGGPSACGATGDNLSDYYGRFSVSWTGGGTSATRASDWLDPLNTGVIVLDGRAECTPPAVPANLAAAPNGDNRIDLAWDAVAGAESYKVFRSTGTCPGSGFTLLASNVVSTSYSDLTVLGGVTYSYRVSAFDTGESCESQQGACDDATATGACPTPGMATLLSPVDGTSGYPLRPTLQWSAAATADDYDLEVDDDADFTSPVYTATVPGTTHVPGSDLPPATLLYWRVTSSNLCGPGLTSVAYRFATSNPGSACSGAITLADNTTASPYPATANIAGFAGTVTTVKIALNGLTHTWPDDLDMLLVGPLGQELVIDSDVGGSIDVSGINLVIDDAAGALLPDDGPLASSGYRPSSVGTPEVFPGPAPASPYGQSAPTGSDTLTSIFGGSNPNGTWSLYIDDDVAQDSGTLQSFCVVYAGAGTMPFLDSFETGNLARWSSNQP